MNCQRVLDILNEYLDGELDALVAVQVERHLVACGQCSEALTELRNLVRLCRSLPEVVPPVGFHQRLMHRIEAQAAGVTAAAPPKATRVRKTLGRLFGSGWPSWAAAAVVVASVGLLTLAGMPKTPTTPGKTEISRSSPPEIKMAELPKATEDLPPVTEVVSSTKNTPETKKTPDNIPDQPVVPKPDSTSKASDTAVSDTAGQKEPPAWPPVTSAPSVLTGTEIRVAESNAPTSKPGAYLIRRINLTVATSDPSAATRSLIAILRQHSGQRLVSSQVGGGIRDQILVPASRETDFFSEILKVGRVVDSRSEVEEITARKNALDERLLYLKSGIEVLNSDAKIAVMKNEYDALLTRRAALLKAAENMEISLTWVSG